MRVIFNFIFVMGLIVLFANYFVWFK